MKGPVKAHPDCKLVATAREPLHYVNSISKTQIDRLGDRFRKGKFGDDELRQLDDFRRSFAEAYEEVVSTVRRATQLEPTGRPAKSTTSIVEKLRRETMRLTQMQDIAGCRLVVQDVLAQDKIAAELMAALPSPVVVDRRKQPSHGYRAVHVIATAQGKPVEIQVRTELQHLWAQLSEKLSDLFDPAIKYGGGDPKIQAMMPMLSEHIADVEAAESQERKEPVVEELANVRKVLRQGLEELIVKLEVSLRKQTGD